MLKQLFRYKWYIIGIVIFMIVEPSINSVLNFWLQRIFNSAAPGADVVGILRLLTIGFLLWIMKRVVSFFSGVLKARFICNAKQDVKHKMFINLLGLNTSNIANIASSGEYISIFTNDIILLETRFYNQIVNLISGIFAIVILGSSFFALNVKLACAIMVFGVISMFVPLIFSRYLNEKNLRYSESISRFTQRIKEYTVAYPTIKNYSIEQMIAQKFDLHNQDTEDTKFEADYALNLANSVGALLSWFMQFIGVGFGIVLVVKGEILIGTVIAAQAFAGDLGMPLQEIIMNVNSIRSVKAIVQKLESLSEGVPAEKSDAENVQSDAGKKSAGCDIVFDDLCLEMGGKTIIDHFSFNFENGKKYLIVGINGSGKSTLFKVLKKWYHSCSGNVTLNGVDINTLTSEDISRKVSYLNENVSLFSGSVKENVALFRKYDEGDFQHAIDSAQMCLQLEREIADEGRNISSGEQRRIEIARSLLESVDAMIFDEVVSTLDIETAYEIEKLALSFEEKTVIFISHNFSGKLIREYDEILVMDSGKLLSHGRYEDLIEKCSYFRNICDIKFG